MASVNVPLANSPVFTCLSKGNPPRIVDLGGVTPTKIDTSDGDIKQTNIVQVLIRSTQDFYLTHAEDIAVATANLLSDDSRGYFPAGVWTFGISGMSEENIYVKSTDGSDYTDALTLAFSERTG